MERYTFDDPAGLLKERMQLMNDTVRGDKKPKSNSHMFAVKSLPAFRRRLFAA